MKFTRITLCLLVLFSFSTIVSAQELTKEEKKEIKKELKQYKKNPASYKKMKEKNKADIAERDQTIEELTKALDKNNAQLLALQDSFQAISRRFNNLLNASSTSIPSGTVYAVQIGFYEQLDLISFNNKIRTIRAEDQGNGKRYVIGYFSDLDDAIQFGSDIKSIGIDDAFVSQYVNGKRNMGFDAMKVK